MRWGSLYPSFCQGFRTTEIGANDHWPLSDFTAVHGLRREKVFKGTFDVAVQCACEPATWVAFIAERLHIKSSAGHPYP